MKRVFLALFLAGCTAAPVYIEPVKPAPPKKPSPIITHRIKFMPHPGNEPYLLLHVQDGVKMKEQTVDTIRYIKEMQHLVCFYEDSYDFCAKTEETK